MTSVAAAERAELCDLFRAVGPEAPTLCEGWTTRDLAAHLVVREHRPDAAAGIVFEPFAAHGEKVRRTAAEQPWPELVALVRNGPPVWNPSHFGPVDELVNTLEFFVHHEDVLRAQPGWTARPLDPGVEDALAAAIGRGGRLLTRKVGVGITLEPDGRQPIRLRGGTPSVAIQGPLADCVLYVHGRKSVSRVELDGPVDAVAQVESASFGV